MSDLLVKLYDLPAESAELSGNYQIRRALAPERKIVVEWVEKNFGNGWSCECDVAFSRLPVACLIALEGDELAGFACYDAIARGFFGPFGVSEKDRHHGIGRALLLATLKQMANIGYAYAIVGAAGSEDFYRKNVDAITIPDSSPGIYKGMLKSK